MKFVCYKCVKIVPENKIVRMPFTHEQEYWCEECYDKWANENPNRHPIKKKKK